MNLRCRERIDGDDQEGSGFKTSEVGLAAKLTIENARLAIKAICPCGTVAVRMRTGLPICARCLRIEKALETLTRSERRGEQMLHNRKQPA